METQQRIRAIAINKTIEIDNSMYTLKQYDYYNFTNQFGQPQIGMDIVHLLGKNKHENSKSKK